jgi:hypothetical protein
MVAMQSTDIVRVPLPRRPGLKTVPLERYAGAEIFWQ